MNGTISRLSRLSVEDDEAVEVVQKSAMTARIRPPFTSNRWRGRGRGLGLGSEIGRNTTSK